MVQSPDRPLGPRRLMSHFVGLTAPTYMASDQLKDARERGPFRSAQEHRETKRRTTSLWTSMIVPLVALILGCSDGAEIVRRQLAQQFGSGTSTVASTGTGATASGTVSTGSGPTPMTGSGGGRSGTGDTTGLSGTGGTTRVGGAGRPGPEA